MSPETKELIRKANELAGMAREALDTYKRHWDQSTPIYARLRAAEDNLIANSGTAAVREWREAIDVARRHDTSDDKSSDRKWRALEAWGAAYAAASKALIAEAGLEYVQT